jgi:hypothetical protein
MIASRCPQARRLLGSAPCRRALSSTMEAPAPEDDADVLRRLVARRVAMKKFQTKEIPDDVLNDVLAMVQVSQQTYY